MPPLLLRGRVVERFPSCKGGAGRDDVTDGVVRTHETTPLAGRASACRPMPFGRRGPWSANSRPHPRRLRRHLGPMRCSASGVRRLGCKQLHPSKPRLTLVRGGENQAFPSLIKEGRDVTTSRTGWSPAAQSARTISRGNQAHDARVALWRAACDIGKDSSRTLA
jgi:hypothetical protein